ncbi:hypothetical protein KI387_039256, partial [Taxus chinensis]
REEQELEREEEEVRVPFEREEEIWAQFEEIERLQEREAGEREATLADQEARQRDRMADNECEA